MLAMKILMLTAMDDSYGGIFYSYVCMMTTMDVCMMTAMEVFMMIAMCD